MATVEEDRTQARIDGLLAVLRDAEAEYRRSYSQVLDVVVELDTERVGAVAGFGTTAQLLAGVLNLSKAEATARAEQAGLLAPRRSLTGETLPPALPTTAAELAAGAIGPAHVKVIAATVRRIPAATHPEGLLRPSRPSPTPHAGLAPLHCLASVSACLPISTRTVRPPPRSPRPCGSCGFALAPMARSA